MAVKTARKPTTSKNLAAPKPTAFRDPPALQRKLTTFWRPSDFGADAWRQLIGGAPIVRSCIKTLLMQIGGIDWTIVSENKDDVEYFTEVLDTSDDGEGFGVHLSRVLSDTMMMPFGGAVEIGAYPDGVVAWQHHVDGGTMIPSYDERYPFTQVDPWSGRAQIAFREEQIGRIRWQAQPSLKAYGWTITPLMDVLPAIQALIRADRFWQSFLSDTPPAGILDVMGMSEQEAQDWYESWKTMLEGIDPLKIPLLYGGSDERTKPAHFIEFNKTPAELSMMEVLKLYAQEVTAGFGMTLGDLGIFDQDQRLAGAKEISNNMSKRQGLAMLMRAYKDHVDMNVLPDGATFLWMPSDTEDAIKKATAANVRATAIATLVSPAVGIFSKLEGRLAAVHYDIIPQEVLDLAAKTPDPFLDTASGTASNAPADDATEGDVDQPTGSNVEDDIAKQRSLEPRAFDPNGAAAKRMTALADRLLAPALKGATKGRLTSLIEIGIKAWGTDPETRSLAGIVRTRASARDALERALNRVNWWKSPHLVREVTDILREAFSEGTVAAIADVEGARLAAGLPGVAVETTTMNVVDPAVLNALETRGGEFITNIDDGTRRYIVDNIMRGVQEGISSPTIARQILADEAKRGIVERWSHRTQSIVNTEINWATSYATLEQQARIGLTTKRWMAISGLACVICLDNMALGFVPNDTLYRTAVGESLHTPGHPGVCHCYMTFDKSELKSLGDDPSYWLGE